MFQLTKGSLRKMLDGNNVTDPVLQIMQLKTIQNNVDGLIRYKVSLYDSEMQHTFGILATQKNSLVESDELKVGSVIKLSEYASNVLSKEPPKVVIILLDFEILGEMEAKIQPAASAESNSATAASDSTTPHAKPIVQNENIEPKKPEAATAPGPGTGKSFYSNKPPAPSSYMQSNKQLAPSSGGANPPGFFNSFKILGIASLNPYQNKWAIKARVTNKSAIRTYNNAKGGGKLFNVEFIDQTGEIRASGFNEQLDKFYDMLQIDNVYFVSKAQLKTANKQYSKLDNDYEMTFNNETVIEQCHDADTHVPHITLNLIPLADLVNKNANDFVDVIAVVKSSSEVTTIVTKATNKELKKRELHLVDDSNCSVNCTLWGKQAEDFDASDNPVVMLKSAKLSDYGGRTLSVSSNTSIQINPDIAEAHKLKGWFEQNAEHAVLQDLSNQMGGGMAGGAGGSLVGQNNWKTLDALRDEKLGMGDKADYITAKAIVLYAKKDNSMYMACPGDNCNKKVVDQNDGTYRCEKCSQNYSKFKWRMILSVSIADHADSNWATCFQETAETILEKSADDIGELKNANSSAFDELFVNCVFKEYNFKLRAKMETYNDERRVKVSVVNVEPIDYVANSKRLLAKIKAYVKNNA